MFYRLTGGEETRRIQDIEFTPFNTDGSSDTNVPPSSGDEVNDIDFKDYKFSADNLPEFTSFQIKIVFRGTNSAYPARLKDFGAIALSCIMSIKYKIEGHSHLQKDSASGAIINTNVSEYQLYMARRQTRKVRLTKLKMLVER